jgi:hypothetical protein
MRAGHPGRNFVKYRKFVKVEAFLRLCNFRVKQNNFFYIRAAEIVSTSYDLTAASMLLNGI